MATCTKCGADSYHLNDAGVCASEFDPPRITTRQGRMSKERLYTLTELEVLMKEYGRYRASMLDSVARGLLALELSIFLTWLKQREKEE